MVHWYSRSERLFMVLMLPMSKAFPLQPFTHVSEDVLSKLLQLSVAPITLFSFRLLSL